MNSTTQKADSVYFVYVFTTFSKENSQAYSTGLRSLHLGAKAETLQVPGLS